MERIKLLMEREGIKSQYELAKRIGIDYKVVNNWFTKRARIPREENLNKIASYFHVHPAWLLYGDALYQPKLENEAFMLAEEIAHYGPEAVTKARQMLKIFFEGTGAEKRYPIQTEKKRRKTA